MKDTRVLKEVIGKVDEHYCFLVNYELGGELYGMYVWGKNTHEAREEVLKIVPEAKTKEIKLGWPR